jgi:L-fuculose-phosphate aldolase
MEQEARLVVASAYRALGAAGLIAGSSGNVSVRLEGGMVISPSGTSPEAVTEAGLVRMGLCGPVPRASSEWALHAALYLARPEFGAIVHTHSDACTALACLGEGMPAFHYQVAGFGGDDVRCGAYVTFGTPELAAVAAGAMEGRTACLLSNHGMIAAGANMAAALGAARTLEILARQYLMARAAGAVRLLTPAEMAAARERYQTYG